jgi:hypothetical protein
MQHVPFIRGRSDQKLDPLVKKTMHYVQRQLFCTLNAIYLIPFAWTRFTAQTSDDHYHQEVPRCATPSWYLLNSLFFVHFDLRNSKSPPWCAEFQGSEAFHSGEPKVELAWNGIFGIATSAQNIHDLADPNILACSVASEPGAKQKK